MTGLTPEEEHRIYEKINFFDDEWTPEATEVINAIIEERLAAHASNSDQREIE